MNCSASRRGLPEAKSGSAGALQHDSSPDCCSPHVALTTSARHLSGDQVLSTARPARHLLGLVAAELSRKVVFILKENSRSCVRAGHRSDNDADSETLTSLFISLLRPEVNAETSRRKATTEQRPKRSR